MTNAKLLMKPDEVLISSPHGNSSPVDFESPRLFESYFRINSVAKICYIVCSGHFRLNAISSMLELIRQRLATKK